MTLAEIGTMLTGLGVTVVFSVLIGYHHKRLERMEKDKQNKSSCDEIVKRMEGELSHDKSRSEEVEVSVNRIEEAYIEQGKLLATIEERITWIAREIQKQNGTT